MAMAADRRLVRSTRSRRDVVLFDENARPFNASASVSAWRGSTTSRRTRSWAVSDGSINAFLSGEVAEMRRRSHDVTRKSPWAQSAGDGFAANAVGNGIVPRPLIEDDVIRRELMEAWDEFGETCDADGLTDIYAMQALVCRSYREGGECFTRLRPRRASDGLSVPLQLQVLEAEYLDPAYDYIAMPNGRIQAGIEFDALNRRLAYHFWRSHPGDIATIRSLTQGDRVRVPAENVLHIFEVLRPGQIRGVPGLSAALAKLYELDKYDDAELMRKQVAAMFAGFVTNPDLNSNPLDAGTDDGEGVDDEGRALASLEPGTMQELEPGQDVKFSTPAESGQSYEPFMRAQLRQVAASAGLTYEQLTNDLSGVNFSSIRAGMIEQRRRMDQRTRSTLIYQFCRPVWRRFVEAAVLSGRVSLPADPVLLRQLTRVAWTVTPGREYVDPEKEARAIILKLRAGLISRSKAVAEHGFDAEALDREIASDNARADDLELRFDGDGRYPQGGGRGTGGGAGGGFGGGGPGRGQEREDDDEPADEQEEAEALAAALLHLRRRRLAQRGALPRGR